MKEYVENMRKYEGNMTKYGLRKNSGPSSRRGESYADTIPEMAPSTKREGGSLAKKLQVLTSPRLKEVNIIHIHT